MHKVKAELIFRNIRKDEERYRLTDDDGNVKIIRVTGKLIGSCAIVGTKGHIIQYPDRNPRFVPDSTELAYWSKIPQEMIVYTGE